MCFLCTWKSLSITSHCQPVKPLQLTACPTAAASWAGVSPSLRAIAGTSFGWVFLTFPSFPFWVWAAPNVLIACASKSWRSFMRNALLDTSQQSWASLHIWVSCILLASGSAPASNHPKHWYQMFQVPKMELCLKKGWFGNAIFWWHKPYPLFEIDISYHAYNLIYVYSSAYRIYVCNNLHYLVSKQCQSWCCPPATRVAPQQHDHIDMPSEEA